MQTLIFGGITVAKKREIKLSREAKSLQRRGVTPKLTSILVGENKVSKLFLSLKKKTAKRVGATLELRSMNYGSSVDSIVRLIDKLNEDDCIHGVMIQLPLPESFSIQDREKVIYAISKDKDVDGMRDDSPYLSPVVRAVLLALKEATNIVGLTVKDTPCTVVVGAEGFVGRKLVKVLKEMGYNVKGVDIETKNLKKETLRTDILISATGVPDLISKDMVKEGAIVIDVGAPKGDVNTKEVVKKTSFISPVPGGIGPVTISYLLENLVTAASRQVEK